MPPDFIPLQGVVADGKVRGMSKTDYTDLDAAITASIERRQPLGFSALCAVPGVLYHSKELAHTDLQNQAWRVVDRRLQALRKAGVIRYQRKSEGWVRA